MLAWTRTAGGVCAVCALVGCGLERRKIPIRMGRARSEGEDMIFDLDFGFMLPFGSWFRFGDTLLSDEVYG